MHTDITTRPWISQQGLGYHNRAMDITTRTTKVSERVEYLINIA
jgi:hypothetical protein